MSRTNAFVALLVAVLLVAASFFLLVKPKMDEVSSLNDETGTLRTQEADLRAQIAALEGVRAETPALEAAIASASSIVPSDSALPSALRQLQTAADDSGATLLSVSPGRPSPYTPPAGAAAIPELSQIPLTLNVTGGYFQIVDLLRRIEDPRITARGILVSAVSVSPAEYPTLSVNITAQMFALLPQPQAPAPAPSETATGEPTDQATEVNP